MYVKHLIYILTQRIINRNFNLLFHADFENIKHISRAVDDDIIYFSLPLCDPLPN